VALDAVHDALYIQTYAASPSGPVNVFANASTITGPADGGTSPVPAASKTITIAACSRKASSPSTLRTTSST
jgi:hypothetical protein